MNKAKIVIVILWMPHLIFTQKLCAKLFMLRADLQAMFLR